MADNGYAKYSGLGGGGGGTPGSGTVTSVGLSLPSSIFNISGSPVTTSGTLTGSFKSLAQNLFLATPNGSSGVLAPRAIVAADIPTLNQNTTGTAANITATSNSTLTTLSSLSLPGSQVTGTVPASTTTVNFTGSLVGDVTGTQGATTLTATTNSSLTTLSALVLPATQLSGTIPAARMPALTGDITTTVGGVATSIVATTNSTITTLTALALPESQVTNLAAFIGCWQSLSFI